MRLTVIGCSGSFPGADSAGSCYLVEADDHRVLVDLGNGALGSLARHMSIYDVDAVLLSHLHPDHFFDLCSYYVARRYHPERSFGRLPVYGPSYTERRLREAYGADSRPDFGAEFAFHSWQARTRHEIGPFRVTVDRVAHPVEAYGLRIEHAGRVVTYSGDSGPTERLVELARDADLFLCEASSVEGRGNPPNLHMTGKQAAEHASMAGVRRLVLTHVPPWNDAAETLAEARTDFSGELDLARPGATFEV